MEKPIRLGVVGAGRRGKNMFTLAGKVAEISQAAFCECQPDRLEEAKELFPDAKPFSDYDEMLDSGLINTILVKTPANNHAEFCAKALRKNRNVLSDVPCVYTYDEAKMRNRSQSYAII